MAFRINSNIAALNALRHLHDTEEALSTNLERLSSGRKLNHASDGPAAMVISEQMKTQIESLDQSIRNSEISMSMLQTTEGALSEVSNILIDMRQLAVHAANEGTNDPKMLQADQNEIENLLSTLGNISRNTQFGTRTLLDGSNSATGVAVGNGLEFVRATETAKSSPAEGYKVDITQVATRAMLVGERMLSLEDVSSSDPSQVISFVINEGGRTVAIDLKSNTTLREQIEKLVTAALRDGRPVVRERNERAIQQLVAHEMQRQTDEAGMNLDIFVYRAAENMGKFLEDFDALDDALTEWASYPGVVGALGGDDVIVIRHREFGSEPNFTVSTSLENYFSEISPANESVFAIPGKDVEGTIGGAPEFDGGEAAIGNGQELSGAPGAEAEGITIRYNQDTDDVIYRIFNRTENRITGLLKRQKDNEFLVGDSIDGYVHLTQNSLAFQTGPNQGQQSKVSVSSVDPEQLARGVDNDSNFRSLSDIEVLSADSAQDSMLMIDEAIDQVSTLRGKLGSFQRNSLEANLNSLRISKENMVASESMLADTDMAEEMSDLVKNQILLSSGTAMLAQANQTPQSVMQLLDVGA